MHKSYFLYKRLLDSYQNEYSESQVISFYTQHKNEFVIETKTGSIIIGLHSFLPYLISKSDNYRKSQSMDLFSGIINDKIISFRILNNFRVIELKLEKHIIYLNLFQKMPGISIYKKNEELISYKHSLDKTLLVSEKIDEMRHLYKLISDEALLLNIKEEQIIKKILESDTLYTFQSNGIRKISLIELKQWNQGQITSSTDLVDSFTSFIYKTISEKRYNDLFSRIDTTIDKEIKQISKTLEKLNSIKVDENQKEIYEQFGHLILANKNLITKNLELLKVPNWYSEKQEEITIKLKTNKTFHENAEIYYQKSKAFDENRKEIEVRKSVYSKKLLELQSTKEDFDKSNTYKELEKVKNHLLRLGYLRSNTNKEKRIMKDKNFNSIEYDFDGELVVVGKDSKSNDYLSLKYAKANDYWFHVHGSPGSHVVLKWHGKKEKPSKELLEKVAALTAYHSKQKNAGTVPVIYTLAKHVRKPRGAAAGSVIVANEKSIFTKPKPYEELV
jgi:predicted ribosome quality control (RQC) complex YloA/Tae2 family protein